MNFYERNKYISFPFRHC